MANEAVGICAATHRQAESCGEKRETKGEALASPMLSTLGPNLWMARAPRPHIYKCPLKLQNGSVIGDAGRTSKTKTLAKQGPKAWDLDRTMVPPDRCDEEDLAMPLPELFKPRVS